MATYNSNIMQAYADEKRIRTMNYHGTVTTTTCSITGDAGNWAKTPGDIVYLTLVPFGAIFGSAKMVFSDATDDTFRYAIGIAGINPDGSFTAIQDLFDITAKVREADEEQQLVTAPYWELTIYQALCETVNTFTKPKAAFEPYADKPLGVLYAKCTALNADPLPFRLNMEWVDPNPSSSPLISTAFEAKAAAIV